jgi:hypothetical protein
MVEDACLNSDTADERRRCQDMRAAGMSDASSPSSLDRRVNDRAREIADVGERARRSISRRTRVKIFAAHAEHSFMLDMRATFPRLFDCLI